MNTPVQTAASVHHLLADAERLGARSEELAI
jgi:hypothetical protein